MNFLDLALFAMKINDLAKFLGDACYGFLAINFFWGLYCVILGWRRVGALSFRNQDQQEQFLEQFMTLMHQHNYSAAAEMTEDDARALPHLAHIAATHHKIGFEPLRQKVMEVMQRDVLGSLEYRTSWIATVIKSGPLLGLFGTVLGMMAAFGRIGEGEASPTFIADEISIALICTAMGLMTAIPFNFLLASMNVRVRRLQDSLSFGLVTILDFIKKEEAAHHG
jgi:biopolymer transport protein ExbB/TolQ